MNSIKYSIIILLLLGTYHSDAAHIVGNKASYEFLEFSGDTAALFRINCTLYRDAVSGGAAFDQRVDFGFHAMINGEWVNAGVISNVLLDSVDPVEINEVPCFDEPSTVSLEQGHYTFVVSVPIASRDFLISYQRCCRSELISNIAEPRDTGFTWNLIITEEDILTGNSSPSFDSDQPVFVCTNTDMLLDVSATDRDGDELRYSICSPLVGGGVADAAGGAAPGCCDCVIPDPNNCPPSFDEIEFTEPFTAEQPLGPSAALQISESGIITGTPDLQGQFVIGVCVDELRDGVVIGTYRRDIQLYLIACEDQPVISYYLDADNDGYGNAEVSIEDCQTPIGYVANDDDCDDDNFLINPAQEEIANNGIDEDCDGLDLMSSTSELARSVVSIYPNPTNGLIFLSLEDVISYKIHIYNMHGTKVMTATNTERIDVSGLAQGTYLVQIQDRETTVKAYARFFKI